MTDQSFLCHLQTFDQKLFGGEVLKASLPAADGTLTLLPRHSALITALGAGPLRLTTSEAVTVFWVSGGVAQMEGGTLSITVRQAFQGDVTPDEPAFKKTLLQDAEDAW